MAIVQAGAYIWKFKCLGEYLSIYRENRASLLKYESTQKHDTYEWTVYTTWQISFEKLTPPSKRFLQLCSYLHYEGIFEDLFKYASEYVSKDQSQDIHDVKDFLNHFLTEGKWDGLTFTDMMSDIQAYSLMTFNTVTKLVATNLIANGKVDEGVQLLCTIDLCAEACRYYWQVLITLGVLDLEHEMSRSRMWHPFSCRDKAYQALALVVRP